MTPAEAAVIAAGVEQVLRGRGVAAELARDVGELVAAAVGAPDPAGAVLRAAMAIATVDAAEKALDAALG